MILNIDKIPLHNFHYTPKPSKEPINRMNIAENSNSLLRLYCVMYLNFFTTKQNVENEYGLSIICDVKRKDAASTAFVMKRGFYALNSKHHSGKTISSLQKRFKANRRAIWKPFLNTPRNLKSITLVYVHCTLHYSSTAFFFIQTISPHLFTVTVYQLFKGSNDICV